MNTQIMSAVADGNLLALTPAQRVEYYEAVCASIGVNPLTRPFGYILFEEKKPDGAKEKRLELYARADLTAQLRKVHGVSIEKEEHRTEADGTIYIHTVYLRDQAGRTDIGTGAVALVGYEGKMLSPAMLANAYMRAETKAKRRGTLSLCGLSVLDESELETVANARIVSAADPSSTEATTASFPDTGNGQEEGTPANKPAPHWIDDPDTRKKFWAWCRNELALDDAQVHEALGVPHIREFAGSKADAVKKINSWVAAQMIA